MTEVKVKLPKQWKHWCQKLNLRRHSSKINKWDRNINSWFYLKGRGFVWRIDCFGHFQRGDRIEDFDRWALCNISEIDFVPNTFKSFESWVIALIEAYKENE